MTSKVAYIVKESGVTLFKDGRQFSAPSDFWSFNRIIEKIKNQNFDGIEELFNTKEAVETVQKEVSADLGNTLGEEVRIVNGEVFVGDKKVYNSVTQRLVKMLASGFDIKPLSNFLKRLLKNPSRTAIQECYPFMEKADVTIDEEGYIIAYKKVRNDYFDIYSGTVNYNIGNIVEMPRNEVDDNRSNLCSDGLHFCSFSYLGHFGSNIASGNRVLIVKVDPADVVSIPADYNDAKARACRMEVIGEIEEEKNVLAETPVYKKTESAPAKLMNEVEETGNVKIVNIPYIVADTYFQNAVNQRVGKTLTFTFVSQEDLEEETLKTLTNVYNNLVSVYNVIQDEERRPTVAMFKCSKVDAVQRIIDLSWSLSMICSPLL